MLVKGSSMMQNADECVIAFPVVGGIFGVARLATKLNELLDSQQIGPWHVGQWIDFKHTAIRIKFLTRWMAKLLSVPAWMRTEQRPEAFLRGCVLSTPRNAKRIAAAPARRRSGRAVPVGATHSLGAVMFRNTFDFGC